MNTQQRLTWSLTTVAVVLGFMIAVSYGKIMRRRLWVSSIRFGRQPPVDAAIVGIESIESGG
ncbi:hypothetical protein GCM10025858_37140 [Alicyclobacillus sacchari]|uniref:hypothetical protein n=1 Tax=Alicyclobacillus sacchari TaxID=392010 RepID=UPI0023EA070A|nr:hypothetical protein [Alicyclobacillus sacchari]GMA59211.1 hypothetical protein GCM10025858_37140 [Alicyclobacillus sacchari]